MLGRKDEAEVIIRLDQKSGKAHVHVVAWPAMFRKMIKLHGVSLDGPEPQYSARWIVPIHSIRIRGPFKRSGKAPTQAFLDARARQLGSFEGVKPTDGMNTPSEPVKTSNVAESTTGAI